jgi:hypothetical protein
MDTDEDVGELNSAELYGHGGDTKVKLCACVQD